MLTDHELSTGETFFVSDEWNGTELGAVVNSPTMLRLGEEQIHLENGYKNNNYNFYVQFNLIQVNAKYEAIQPRNIYVAYDDIKGHVEASPTNVVDMNYAIGKDIYTNTANIANLTRTTIIGLEEYIKLGYTYEATFKVSEDAAGDDLRKPGYYEGLIEIDTFTLYDSSGIPVEKQFEFKPGNVKIYSGKLVITTNSETKVYDGKPLVGTYSVEKPADMSDIRVFINGKEELTGNATTINECVSKLNEVDYKIVNLEGEDMGSDVLVEHRFGT